MFNLEKTVAQPIGFVWTEQERVRLIDLAGSILANGGHSDPGINDALKFTAHALIRYQANLLFELLNHGKQPLSPAAVAKLATD